VINGSSVSCVQTSAQVVGRLAHTKTSAISRPPHTMTWPRGLAKMTRMRNMVIVAMVALGAVRIVWRVLSPAQRPAFATEWAADE
jgi:hypothetical protein